MSENSTESYGKPATANVGTEKKQQQIMHYKDNICAQIIHIICKNIKSVQKLNKYLKLSYSLFSYFSHINKTPKAEALTWVLITLTM